METKLISSLSLPQDVAIVVYNRMNQDRSNLIDEKRNDLDCRPPFFWHHIRTERRRCGIWETWQQAPPGSTARDLFDRGQTNGEHAPNWVTLWLLYSVFRSRDFRNNRNRRLGYDAGEGGGSGSGRSGKCVFVFVCFRAQCALRRLGVTGSTDQVRIFLDLPSALAGSGSSGGTETKYYDPARNAHLVR